MIFPKLLLLLVLTCSFSFSLHAQLTFTEVSGIPFPAVEDMDVRFADIDNDNDQDVLITGFSSTDGVLAHLYTNDGSGTFTLLADTTIEALRWGATEFADIDNDNDLDLLVTGRNTSNVAVAVLYTNDGSGGFTPVNGTPFVGLFASTTAFGDLDGDDDLDLIMSGATTGGQYTCRMYQNDGSGTFTEITGHGITGMVNPSIAYADVDQDQDLDLVISGLPYGGIPNRATELYLNDSTGSFTLAADTSFDGLEFASVAFADVDGDQDQDLLIAGVNRDWDNVCKLYKNDGLGVFERDTLVPFEGVNKNGIAFTDLDRDGDQDLLITGISNANQRIGRVYLNDGVGRFAELADANILGVEDGNIAVADINGDQFPDFLISGATGFNVQNNALYTTCANSQFSFSKTVCDSYTSPSGLHVWTETGIYQDTLISTAGCDSLITVELTVTEINKAVSQLGLTLTATMDSATYQWIDCNNGNAPIPDATGQSFTPTANGSYAVLITYNGCTQASVCSTISTTSLEDDRFRQSISVYPNPVVNRLQIDLGDLHYDISISLTDINGKVVYTGQYQNLQYVPLILNQSQGLYFLTVVADHKKAVMKVVVE